MPSNHGMDNLYVYVLDLTTTDFCSTSSVCFRYTTTSTPFARLRLNSPSFHLGLQFFPVSSQQNRVCTTFALLAPPYNQVQGLVVNEAALSGCYHAFRLVGHTVADFSISPRCSATLPDLDLFFHNSYTSTANATFEPSEELCREFALRTCTFHHFGQFRQNEKPNSCSELAKYRRAANLFS